MDSIHLGLLHMGVKMSTINRTSRILGVAFLFQFITSLTSGLIMQSSLIVKGNIGDTMVNITDKALLMRLNIVGDMLTAVGIVFLGAILYSTLRRQGEKMALVAFGCYIFEAVLLAFSKMQGFTLLRISQEYVSTGFPAYLKTMGSLSLESMNYCYTLHMLPFCLGAILFYFLLYRSGIIPRALSLWGLITVFPLLASTLLTMVGVEVPIIIFGLPYVPFEFVVGVWVLIKGINDTFDKRSVNNILGDT